MVMDKEEGKKRNPYINKQNNTWKEFGKQSLNTFDKKINGNVGFSKVGRD